MKTAKAQLPKRLAKGDVALLVLLVFIALFAPFSPSLYYVSLLGGVFVFAIFGLSLDMVLGYAGIVSLGHALFFGLGAYGMGILLVKVELALPAAALILLVIGVVAGVTISALTLRLRGIYFTMVTMALAEFFYILSNKWNDFTGGSEGLRGIVPPGILAKPIGFYYLALALLVVIYVLARRMVNSPVGRVWAAIRENESRCEHVGFNVFAYKSLVIVISGVFATLAGGLYALSLHFVDASVFATPMSFSAILMCVVGGLGTLYGPIAGAAIVTLLGPILSSYTVYWQFLMGIVYLAIVLFFPHGLVYIFQSARPDTFGILKKWYGGLRARFPARRK